ncbi:ammonium transporter [Athelia psychrophila]|uniref:Ammonium transporter n=1 Tax=Athelia psychrophila TaxID=1759441 RepID=A0A167UMJ4_9AGAM|nr:ammonium transporter [Fibularhizoctonia sp. CBS 109695]
MICALPQLRERKMRRGQSISSNTEFLLKGGDIAWTLASTTLVWIMIPCVGFFYSGLLRRKNALSMIYLSMMTLAVVSFQWFFWGFSLAFSETGSAFIGDLKYFGLKGVLEQPSIGSTRIPSIVFCVYQLMFAAITPILAIGAVAERSKLGPLMVFVFVWSTLVYDHIACWTWNSNGWSFHIYLGKRRGWGTERLAYKPHNTSYVVLGTVFLWFGWFGFNGGSALSANLRAAQACIVTNLAASVGGLTWMLWDYWLEKKWSAVGFCSGAIAGLVAITPASGFMGSPAAVLFGVAAGTVCNFATQLKFFFHYDDALDIFASHAIGGVVGNVLTGIFAQKSVAAFDGVSVIGGGWLDGHFIQLGYQIADSVSGMCSEESEIIGIDDAEMGEYAYDYVGLETELAPPKHTFGEDALEGAVGGGREPMHHVHHQEKKASSEGSRADEKDGVSETPL